MERRSWILDPMLRQVSVLDEKKLSWRRSLTDAQAGHGVESRGDEKSAVVNDFSRRVADAANIFAE